MALFVGHTKIVSLIDNGNSVSVRGRGAVLRRRSQRDEGGVNGTGVGVVQGRRKGNGLQRLAGKFMYSCFFSFQKLV